MMSRVLQLGPGGLVAAALLTVSAGLAGWFTPGWLAEAQQAQAQQRAQSLRALASRHAAARAAQAASAAGAARQPVQPRLPPALLARQRLANLQELAIRHGVQLQSVEQRLQRDAADAEAERVVLNMPAQADYADLRAFIEAALRADAALSLDLLRLRREQLQSPSLRAELVWSLHQQRSGNGAAS
jgi:hypothetical protein